MGYSYSLSGHLCCDYCGSSGETRKHRCPFGFCPATAACPDCRRKHRDDFTCETHRKRGCEAGHLRFVEERQKRLDLLNAGKFVRRAALGHDEKGVKVLFENARGLEAAYWMSHETYDAISLFTPATPEDYAKYGQVQPAETTKLMDAR